MEKEIIVPTPKYKVNQTVYFISEWGICYSTIVNIVIEVCELNQTVKYQVIGTDDFIGEEKLYASKEELFKSTPLKQLLPF